MMRRILSSLTLAVAFTTPLLAQSGPTKATLQAVCDAWASKDMTQPVKYYSQDPKAVFFDVSPLKYNGFAEYAKGAAEYFNTVKSVVLKVNDDAVVHQINATNAWSTATLQASFTGNDDKVTSFPARWTAIWQKQGSNWVILHDHVSAPMQ